MPDARFSPTERSPAEMSLPERDVRLAGTTRQLRSANRSLAASDRAHSVLDHVEVGHDRPDTALGKPNTYLDLLTGALARDAGSDQLQRTVDHARRHAEPVMIVMARLERRGPMAEQTADRLLSQVGRSLLAHVRSYDTVVRWGAAEFLCALAGATPEPLERRFAQLGSLFEPEMHLSVGVVELTVAGELNAAIADARRLL